MFLIEQLLEPDDNVSVLVGGDDSVDLAIWVEEIPTDVFYEPVQNIDIFYDTETGIDIVFTEV